MRKIVREFLRASIDLSGSAHHNNGALTNEERETVRTCIETIQNTVLGQQDDEATA